MDPKDVDEKKKRKVIETAKDCKGKAVNFLRKCRGSCKCDK